MSTSSPSLIFFFCYRFSSFYLGWLYTVCDCHLKMLVLWMQLVSVWFCLLTLYCRVSCADTTCAKIAVWCNLLGPKFRKFILCCLATNTTILPRVIKIKHQGSIVVFGRIIWDSHVKLPFIHIPTLTQIVHGGLQEVPGGRNAALGQECSFWTNLCLATWLCTISRKQDSSVIDV